MTTPEPHAEEVAAILNPLTVHHVEMAIGKVATVACATGFRIVGLSAEYDWARVTCRQCMEMGPE